MKHRTDDKESFVIFNQAFLHLSVESQVFVSFTFCLQLKKKKKRVGLLHDFMWMMQEKK